MKVVNTQAFQLVYSILEHAHLGFVIEPHVVQVNSLGHLTLSHQKLFSANFDYYASGLDDLDRKAVRLLEEIEQERIVKKYYTKSAIRPAEYFKKHFDPELFKKIIRPFIEKKLGEAIPLLQDKPIFLYGKDGNPASVPVRLEKQRASVLFHFRRDPEQGTNYFPTIKCGEDRVEFKGKNGILLVNQPAWLLNEGVLYSFEKNVDGNKLKPFLQKKFIHIPKATEETYFEKFVVPLVEKFDVYAVGFDIVSESTSSSPVLSIDNSWGDRIRLNLSFQYNQQLFPYHTAKKVSVFLEKQENHYVFHRLRRKRDWEEEIRNALEFLGLELLQGSSFVLKNPGAHFNAMDWLNAQKDQLDELGFTIHQDPSKKYFLGTRTIEVIADEEGDWFDIRAKVMFGSYEIPFTRLRRYILDGQREFTLPNGELAIIPDAWFTQFLELMELSKEENGLKVHRHHWKLLEEFSPDSDENLAKYSSQEEWVKQVPATVTPEFSGELRPYQLDGFHWFYFLKNNHFGGCLADDMGLGKTIQALALLANERLIEGKQEEALMEVAEYNVHSEGKAQISLFDLQEKKGTRTAAIKQANFPQNLVVVPTSLVYNWANEAAKFVPHMHVVVHTGTGRSKEASSFKGADIVLTTYGVLRLDIDLFKDIAFHYIILDESQSIKNPASLTAKTVKMLQSKHKLALTGTPIENSVNDLWSQMHFVNPGLLGSYSYFQKRFVIPIEKEGNEKRRARLHQLISPFVLRRTKKEVAKDLPDKYEQIYYCEMTEEQQKVYDETKSVFRNQILQTVNEIGFKKSKLQILKGLILLRQMANHPKLADPDFLGESGKFLEICSMLETAIEEGHKILLFSQFVKHLSLFREYLAKRKIDYCYLDGATPMKDRQKQVEEFNQNPEIKLFLISLKAGGTGLNLTSADYVFMADPWWNPAVEQQAIDRAHRIGQTQKVFSYKFITKNSVEEKIVSLQKKKLDLASEIIDTDDYVLKNMDLVDLEELLGE